MVPASPPLPTTCNLPFQFSAGSQTSKLIADVGVGFSRPWTWQKAGSSSARALPRPAGMANGPAATDLTSVIVVFASERLLSASQLGAANKGAAVNESRMRRVMESPLVEILGSYCIR